MREVEEALRGYFSGRKTKYTLSCFEGVQPNTLSWHLDPATPDVYLTSDIVWMQTQCQLTETSLHLLACINDQVQRLTSLTLMHIHYHHTINYDEVVDISHACTLEKWSWTLKFLQIILRLSRPSNTYVFASNFEQCYNALFVYFFSFFIYTSSFIVVWYALFLSFCINSVIHVSAEKW